MFFHRCLFLNTSSHDQMELISQLLLQTLLQTHQQSQITSCVLHVESQTKCAIRDDLNNVIILNKSFNNSQVNSN